MNIEYIDRDRAPAFGSDDTASSRDFDGDRARQSQPCTAPKSGERTPLPQAADTPESRKRKDLLTSMDAFFLASLGLASEAAPDNVLLAAVAKHGRVFRRVSRLPPKLSGSLPSQSRANCISMLRQPLSEDYFYAEGFVFDFGKLAFVPHSWLVNAYGEAIDLTRSDTTDSVFVGIALETKRVLEASRDTPGYRYLVDKATDTSHFKLGDLEAALVQRFSARISDWENRPSGLMSRFWLPEPNADGAVSLVSQLMAVDLRDGVITPNMSLVQLKSRYDGVYTEGALHMMMREACRLYEGLVGTQMVVADGKSGRVLERFDCPLGESSPELDESIALAVLEEAIERDKNTLEGPERDSILHVYTMPATRACQSADDAVTAYGEHFLTYQRWKDGTTGSSAERSKTCDAPFPGTCYVFSSRRGYQGFDGRDWRNDWRLHFEGDKSGATYLKFTPQ